MIQIQNILCPVNLSDCSERAVDYAAGFARWYKATLTLLYVFPNLPVADLPPLVLSEHDRQRLLDDLRNFTRSAADLALEFRIREAPDVHRQILEEAEGTTDLLVMGSHGRSGLNRVFLGSVTERVIRQPVCPTMIVPPGAGPAEAHRPVPFTRILCPVDFSESSQRALTYAIAMAEESDARLTALHVIEIPPEWRERRLFSNVNVDQIRAAAEAASLRQLRGLIPDEARTYCTVETAVQEGAAHKEIVKLAAERSVDVIVVGRHGHGSFGAKLSGSTAARVIRAAPSPVIVV